MDKVPHIIMMAINIQDNLSSDSNEDLDNINGKMDQFIMAILMKKGKNKAMEFQDLNIRIDLYIMKDNIKMTRNLVLDFYNLIKTKNMLVNLGIMNLMVLDK